MANEEANKLRCQIQFLTDLIKNAENQPMIKNQGETVGHQFHCNKNLSRKHSYSGNSFKTDPLPMKEYNNHSRYTWSRPALNVKNLPDPNKKIGNRQVPSSASQTREKSCSTVVNSSGIANSSVTVTVTMTPQTPVINSNQIIGSMSKQLHVSAPQPKLVLGTVTGCNDKKCHIQGKVGDTNLTKSASVNDPKSSEYDLLQKHDIPCSVLHKKSHGHTGESVSRTTPDGYVSNSFSMKNRSCSWSGEKCQEDDRNTDKLEIYHSLKTEFMANKDSLHLGRVGLTNPSCVVKRSSLQDFSSQNNVGKEKSSLYNNALSFLSSALRDSSFEKGSARMPMCTSHTGALFTDNVQNEPCPRSQKTGSGNDDLPSINASTHMPASASSLISNKKSNVCKLTDVLEQTENQISELKKGIYVQSQKNKNSGQVDPFQLKVVESVGPAALLTAGSTGSSKYAGTCSSPYKYVRPSCEVASVLEKKVAKISNLSMKTPKKYITKSRYRIQRRKSDLLKVELRDKSKPALNPRTVIKSRYMLRNECLDPIPKLVSLSDSQPARSCVLPSRKVISPNYTSPSVSKAGSRYVFRQNTNNSSMIKQQSSGIKIVKSKYKLRKFPTADYQNMGRHIWQNSTFSSAEKPGNVSLNKRVLPSSSEGIIKSKYKLQRVGVEKKAPSYQNIISSHTQTAAKVIKTKYKLRRVTNSGPVSKSSGYQRTHWQRGCTALRKCTTYPHYSKEKRRIVSSKYNLPHSWRSVHWSRNPISNLPRFKASVACSQKTRYSWRRQNRTPREKQQILARQFVIRNLQKTRISQNTQTSNRLKIDRRNTTRVVDGSMRNSVSSPGRSKTNSVSFVMINGMLYKSSRQKLVCTSKQMPRKAESTPRKRVVVKRLNSKAMKTITVRGVKFQMDSSGKTLRRMGTFSSPTRLPSRKVQSSVSRVDIGGMTYIQTRPGMLERSVSVNTRAFASRVVNKSIATATAKFRKDNTKGRHQHCLYFNRFGKCRRGDKCPYIHDPERIAICTRFLRGTCKVDNCPFSHKVSKEKMPVCSYFLKGICSRDNCPYLHVNVSQNAVVCQDFIQGYCLLGEKCKKKHSRICLTFSRTGSCPDGRKCKLFHRKKIPPRTISGPKADKFPKLMNPVKSTSVSQSLSIASKHKIPTSSSEESDDDHLVPFKRRKLPAYIALSKSMDEPDSQPATPGTPLNNSQASTFRIKPQL